MSGIELTPKDPSDTKRVLPIASQDLARLTVIGKRGIEIAIPAASLISMSEIITSAIAKGIPL